MPQLHETMYGRRFFESDLPQLVKNLGRIADNLEPKETVQPEVKNDLDTLQAGWKSLTVRAQEALGQEISRLKRIVKYSLYKPLKEADEFPLEEDNNLYLYEVCDKVYAKVTHVHLMGYNTVEVDHGYDNKPLNAFITELPVEVLMEIIRQLSEIKDEDDLLAKLKA